MKKILKKHNQRKCILTKNVANKSNFIRIVMTKDGEFKVNSNYKGRGTYITKDKNLIPTILKKRVLHKVFKTNVPKIVYEQLIKVLLGDLNEKK